MLSVIVGNDEFSLDDGSLCRLRSFTGWGMSPLHRLSERGPMQHGETDRGYRLDPRLGTLILQLESVTLESMWALRSQLLNLFKPANNPKLKWVLPSGLTVQIDCHYHDDMTLEWTPDKWGAQSIAVTLRCPDPTFYDPVQISIPFGLSGGGTGWGIPWAIPWNLGQSTLDQTVGITYTGTFRTYPTIRFVGPITNPAIYNLTTNEKLAFTVSIAGGDYYEIDCRYGIKSVVDSSGVNRIDKLTTDSDLTNFHIAEHPEALGGINSFRVTGTGINANTQIYLRYYNRYVGI